MMFPKPQKKVKEKPLNSLQNRKPKQKKEIAPWRQNILSHHQERPSTKDRGEFSRSIVAELIAEANGKCQSCKVNPDTTTHHVQPRGRQGRGVKSNGLRLCWMCHDRIQTNEDELQYWISVFEKKYGPRFWFDDQDWADWEKKQTAIRESEHEQKQRMEELEPIVTLLTTAAGRSLKAKELRLIDGFDEGEIVTFAKLMSDIIRTQVRDSESLAFGYGHFND